VTDRVEVQDFLHELPTGSIGKIVVEVKYWRIFVQTPDAFVVWLPMLVVGD
jgi:hypothetical protein